MIIVAKQKHNKYALYDIDSEEFIGTNLTKSCAIERIIAHEIACDDGGIVADELKTCAREMVGHAEPFVAVAANIDKKGYVALEDKIASLQEEIDKLDYENKRLNKENEFLEKKMYERKNECEVTLEDIFKKVRAGHAGKINVEFPDSLFNGKLEVLGCTYEVYLESVEESAWWNGRDVITTKKFTLIQQT